MIGVACATIAFLAAPVSLIRSLHGFIDETAKVRIEVQVPAETPSDSEVYIAGNIAEFGGWKANGRRLQRREDGIYETEVQLRAGDTMEFKFTLGSWRKVEKDKLGKEMANRHHVVTGDVLLRCEVENWADVEITPASTATGNLKILEVESPFLKSPRRVTVWLPPDYEQQVEQRYGVLYMLDGQNVFDRARAAFGTEWQADETMHRLITEKKIEPWIIVAIDNSSDRIAEYTMSAMSGQGGDGARFLNFVQQSLKPMIDEQFRTNPQPESTAIAGSSLGGLLALYAILEHSDCFRRAMVMSPSLFWDDEQLLRTIELRAAQNADQNESNIQRSNQKVRIWIDMGDQEGSRADQQKANVDRVLRLHRALIEMGFKDDDQLKLMVEAGAGHQETAWAGRLPEALEFTLANGKP